MNKWIGIGRLTQDPELRKTGNDISVCSFTIAIDRRFSTGGEKQTDFINCVAWRQTADFVNKYFIKGKMIAVEGSIQVRSWEDDGGNKRYATEAVIDNVEFCGDGNKDENKQGKQPDKPVKSSSKQQSKPQPESGNEELEDDDDLPF